jgi:2-methylcitrate dehydratase PrpD
MTEATARHRPDAATADATLAERLGADIADIRVGTFDGAATAKLGLCVLDFLACTFEASSLPWARQAAALATPDGGPCAIVGTPIRSTAADAAFANSVAGHGLVREDMHTGSVSHLGVAVLPALLALAQEKRVDGRTFATAAIIGYEVGARFGRALVTPEFARAFRPTGFTGPLASAAACSLLLGLSPAETASALSLAANMVSGLNQWPATGADDMYFHTGAATRNGLVAARLASLGAWGSPAALDGDAGLLPNYRPDRKAPDIALFGEEPEIMSVFFKPVPVCNFAQTPCLAALALASKIGNPAAIETVDVAVTRAAQAYPGCDHAGPFARVLQAKMSIQYAVAAAILGGKVDEGSYADLDDPALLVLAGKIRVRKDDKFTAAFPRKQGASVTVRLSGGQVFHEKLEDVAAADEQLVRNRFRQAATAAVGAARATEIEAALDGLASADDLGALMRLTMTGN